ncbi:MAG TPA: hypothetical protein VMY38_00080 [Gemmatimonadaceae bacterium]|nr:hypothetical protein [Gemmatimonadaceae bacterium]
MKVLSRVALVLAIAAVAGAADAQEPEIEVLLPAAAKRALESPFTRTEGLLGSPPMNDLMRSGFPARIRYKIERWATGGWADDLRATREWNVVVRYDQLVGVFRVMRVFRGAATELGEAATIAGADSIVARLTRTPMPPPRRGERSYYTLTIELEMLSLGDLDELEHWLRGEFRPAVRGERNPGTALTRGIRTLIVRLLGGEKRRYEARSATFTP